MARVKIIAGELLKFISTQVYKLASRRIQLMSIENNRRW